ncbi:hypothetical protein MUGA111182_04550 [Mucilaginibacter galii]|uniref:Adhesin domain-containing protein n=1 Tax=Mucilaginibacter galii TaxID=2005073 RepID=A0A917J8S0_9SPHI|nr:hypothetical protein [Mucilaginibacter galii]GGI50848.1 hypothetical protein GCM10011425_20600 [Mucilaginibacter galii]
MKLKIFNPKLLLLCAILATAQGSFAQNNKTQDEKEFDLQMQKLQTQMRDLQKQMSKLQTEKLKEKSVELKKMAKELSTQVRVYTNDYDVSGLSKGLGINVDPKLFVSSRFNSESLKGLNNLNLNFNTSDDKKLQEQIKSGDVKEKTKTYSKSYSVDGNDKLVISNTYGRVTVNTWAKNEVKVDVQIKTYANEDDDAQKMLDNISVTDSKENSVISFKTNIERTNSSSGNNLWGSWFSSGKSNTRKSEINYTVYMPAKNQLQISNTYGNVILPELTGKVSLKITYGALTSQQLTNPDIRLVYGDARISGMTDGDVSITYGNLNLGTADKLKAKVTYGGINIDRLKSYGELAAVYGDGIKITELDKNCKNVNVKAVYTTVNLGVKSDYDFDVTTTSGSFNYDKSAVKVLTTTPAEGTRSYTITRNFKGQVNKGDTDKLITIKSTYANVKFD